MEYREMEIADYDDIISLWQVAEGICLRDAGSKKGIEKYLLRNPSLSFVAIKHGKLIGTVMSGHDGKRGYIQHLVVDSKSRRNGVASSLLKMCLSALRSEGIIKSHIHVLTNNEQAKSFWENHGWVKRTDIDTYSYINGGNAST